MNMQQEPPLVEETASVKNATMQAQSPNPQAFGQTEEEIMDSQGKRRRIANKKYDDGFGNVEEDFGISSTPIPAKIMRKNSEEFGCRVVKSVSKQAQLKCETQAKPEKMSGSNLPYQITTARSRISIALSTEKISRILMRALQVFGPLNALQCTQLINQKRKPNVEELALKTVSAILQLLAATPVVNRMPKVNDDDEEVYVWHESCNSSLNQSQGEESLREPLRVSTALAEVARGKLAVADVKERIQLIKLELKNTPEENSVRSLQNFLQSVLSSRRELFDPSLHPKHTDLMYRRACRVARLTTETHLSESTSMFDAKQIVSQCSGAVKQHYEFEEHLPFDVSQYNINAHYDMGYNHKSSTSSSSSIKSERRPYHKREKSNDSDTKVKKPVTPSAYSAWCREGMLIRHKSGRDGHILRLKGPWIEVKFIGAKNSCATRVSDLQPVATSNEDMFP